MSEQKESMTRRDFMRFVLMGVGTAYAAAVGYPVYWYLTSPAERAHGLAAIKEVNLKDAHKLPLGAALMFKFGSRPAMLIHHKDDSWVALDAVCTHLACTVEYQADRNAIHCNCHGGEYDAKTGKNISGPPPKPLKQYVAKVLLDGVLVSRT